MTCQVVTLWYRAPELCFGAVEYGPSIDMWAVGCIFAELLRSQPMFVANSELELLSKVFSVLGTPSEKDWPGLSSLPSYMSFTAPVKVLPLENVMGGTAPPHSVDLLKQMFCWDPTKRISAKDALEHEYFKGECTPPELLPRVKK